MEDQNGSPFPWRVLFPEFVGTALLVLVGLSVATGMLGAGTPVGGACGTRGCAG